MSPVDEEQLQGLVSATVAKIEGAMGCRIGHQISFAVSHGGLCSLCVNRDPRAWKRASGTDLSAERAPRISQEANQLRCPATVLPSDRAGQ
jgi:hypothetical protein